MIGESYLLCRVYFLLIFTHYILMYYLFIEKLISNGIQTDGISGRAYGGLFI
jgi:hypothetical protein